MPQIPVIFIDKKALEESREFIEQSEFRKFQSHQNARAFKHLREALNLDPIIISKRTSLVALQAELKIHHDRICTNLDQLEIKYYLGNIHSV